MLYSYWTYFQDPRTKLAPRVMRRISDTRITMDEVTSE